MEPQKEIVTTKFITGLLNSNQSPKLKDSFISFIKTIQKVVITDLLEIQEDLNLQIGSTLKPDVDPELHIQLILLTLVEDELTIRGGQAIN